MSKPTRKELTRRLDLVEHEVDVLAAQLRAAQKVLLRLDPQQQSAPTRTRPPREVVRRPWPLRWWDQLTGLWGCSWVILAVVAAPHASTCDELVERAKRGHRRGTPRRWSLRGAGG